QRGTGECLITLATRPNISKEILANNGVVLTFKNHIEKDIMCDLLNIDTENRNFLSILEEGQCIIRTNSIKEPFLLGVPLIKHESLPVSEIKNNNDKILNKVEKSFETKSNSKNTKFYDFFQNTIKKLRCIYLKNSKEKSSKLIKLKPNTPQICSKTRDNSKIKNDISQNNFELESYSKLKDYINHLYNLQKKKE
ncbi:MAG: hypothetical protein ACFFA7_18950, partial [Promethearchaeota archaeon]